ncbi:MAG: hypothetical protein LBQ66_12550 [Planctomycetaceae bacterium]|jgi:hypothetical protein|nr:hypothetical protein [Planctomycetaceae bacterium]
MTENQFKTILIFLVPQVVKKITEHFNCDDVNAVRSFYSSKLYALLEQEETKLWHFSPLNLFTLYEEETRTGNFNLPEEC